ncbi:MAG: SCP2 sterol-binding domain-containing protein [Anaerolineales bacterium]|nr:MAG: SCP2 sterol-binding domain-containing protein [Anaerolineales bacterium]
MPTFETAEEMQEVLRAMAELMQVDAALLRASKGKNLTISYEFPDLDVFFYTNFLDGSVEAGLDEWEDADIQLTMDSDIFDGMFTGRVNAAKAAMKGELAFSGNVASAMRLQGLMDDFKRLYMQAKGQAHP